MKKILILGLLVLASWSMALYADGKTGTKTQTKAEKNAETNAENNRSIVAGLEYQVFDPPLAVQTENLSSNQVEVAILFLYACPHCNALDAKLTTWAKEKGERIVLKRLPAIVGAPWAEQARAFYTAEELGILEKAHAALFKSIHEEGVQYTDDQSVMDFFTTQGVEPEAFASVFQSAKVDEKIRHARRMTVEYGIRGVPAIVINGKYLSAQYFTGTQERLMEVLDMLVEKELKAIEKT